MIKLLFSRFLKAFLVAFVLMIAVAYMFGDYNGQYASELQLGIVAFGGILFLIFFIYGLIGDLKEDLKKSPKLKKEIEEFGVLGTINRHVEKGEQ